MPQVTELQSMRAKHEVLARFPYQPQGLEAGYTGVCLRVDVGANEISTIPVTPEMKELFIGGKGFDLRLLWDEVNPETRWDSPENSICISSGPLGGTATYTGAGKSLVTTISPTTEIPIDSNVGGYFGPLLKFSGWDALVVTGIASQEVIVVIDGNCEEIRIETAPDEAVDAHVVSEQLHHMFARDDKDLVNISVVSTGQAAEHCLIGCLNFSWYDWRRRSVRMKQAGRGGIGTVLRKKKIKAVMVHAKPWKNRWSISINNGQPEEGA